MSAAPRRAPALSEIDLSVAFASAASFGTAARPLARYLPDAAFVGPKRHDASTRERSTAPLVPERHRRSRSGAHRGTLAPGTILDKFRIEEVLGTGAFAVVYRATHLLLRVPVAIKLLRPELMQAQRAAAQLVEEARCAVRIRHPNVVQVIDVTCTHDRSYIVMELIEGRTLLKAIQTAAPLPTETVMQLAMDVVAGLAAGYEQGLVHRDVKPANIMLSRGGCARLVDFGLAAATAEADTSQGQCTFVGTRGYAAPEVVAGRRATFRSDIFSLGVTLYEAATGTRLSVPAQASDVLVRPDVSRCGPLADILPWMLEAHPMARPSSYAELSRALAERARGRPRG